MSFKRNGLRSRRDIRRKWSRNQVAAKERLRMERLANASARAERELAEAEQWEKDNPPPKLPPPARIRIEIPGLPAKSITVRRFGDKILTASGITTAKQLGRKIGTLLEQFMP